jgi:nitrous oxidase accessory protein NosD
MSDHHITEADGWGGIATALKRAQPGDRVLIGPGRYEGDETLNVPSGVTLSGCAEAELEFTGLETAIAVCDAHDVLIEGLKLSGCAGLDDASENGVAPVEDALIFVSQSRQVAVCGCAVRAKGLGRTGIEFVQSCEIRAVDNAVSGASLGIRLSSTRGHLEQNACSANFHGIVLQRSEHSPDAPSAAVLRGNRCHDNVSTGIMLVSSTSDAVEANECWANGDSGIVLQRDPKSPNAPSAAVLRGNRCHDNALIGIVLYSSTSGAVEANECWANGGNGIALQRDPKSPNAPSDAVLRGNRCHNNASTGIVFVSSTSDAVEDNAAWNNRGCGIDLKGSDKTGHPSNALLRNNVFQGNRVNPIHFSASTGSASSNRFKGHDHNGVLVDKPQFHANIADPKLSDNIVDKTLDLPSMFLPDLRAALADAQLRSPRAKPLSEEGLADFLISGSSGGFRTFWTGQHHAPEPLLAAVAPPETRYWRLVPSLEVRSPTLTRLSVQLAAGLLGTLVNRAARKADGRANWSALVISDDRDADDILEALTVRAVVEEGSYVAEGERMGPPLSFAMTDGDATLRERLSLALMQGKSWGRERFTLLAKVVVWPALILLGVAAGVWFSPWSIPIAAQFATFGIWEWLTAGVLTFSGLLASLSVFDLFLPRHLRASMVGSGAVATEGFKQVFGGAIVPFFDVVTKLVPSARRETWADSADMNWQRRLLFAMADIATLYLADVTKWRDGDLIWLGLLSESLTETQKLNVLIELDGRLSIRHLLVEPPESPWQDGIELYLFDDVDKLRLGANEDISAELSTVDVALLGADHDASELRTSLRDDVWCPADLVATLPIASAPTQRLRLAGRRLPDATQLAQTKLARLIYPAAKKLFTTDSIAAQIDPTSFWWPFDLAEKSRAFWGYKTDAERLIAGRTGYRREVAELLRGIWTTKNDDRQNWLDWHEYVTSALRFGIWHGVTGVAEILESPLSREISLQVRRTLEAVQFLGEDLRNIMVANVPLHGEDEVFVPAWVAMRAAMMSLDDGPDAVAVIGTWFGAEEICFGELPSAAAHLLADIEHWLADPVACNDAKPEKAIDAFAIAMARQLIELRQLDPRSMDHALERAEATVWRGYPKQVVTRLSELARGRGANNKSLAMMFAHAKDAATIEKLIQEHRRSPIRTVYALANAATNHVIADHLAEGVVFRFDDRLPPIARTLADLREVWIAKHGELTIRLSGEFAKGASGAAVPAQPVYDYFISGEAAARIAELLQRDTVSNLEDLEGKFELELAG